ncbi:uncharacterized protein LOC133182609 [Saccostrea echinata]|uniref:uncharacterized protein LOC133182609 n=1 Tax=Saccostrea echinata TaxID=191078 RepID=UPI002A80D31A|nr:uncharacterized protein LOC133182609 [Saccostrea echinata]
MATNKPGRFRKKDVDQNKSLFDYFEKKGCAAGSFTTDTAKLVSSILEDIITTVVNERKHGVEKVTEKTIDSWRQNSDDEKLFRTIFYEAKEELPNDKVNSLLELQNLNGAIIKYKNVSWDTVKEIQSCIATIFTREIIKDIMESSFYAVMIDESTDLTVQKHLSLCIRYVKDGEAVTKFLANVSVEDGKAHTIVQRVVQCLEEFGLDPSKIVSLATDGASTMMGKKTGKLLGEPELTVKEPHAIRWLGLKNAVEAVFESYNSVLATLSNFAAEKQSQAHGLLKYFSEYKTVLMVAFVIDVHEVLGCLSKQLQKQDIVFSDIQPLMDATLGKLDSLEAKDGSAQREIRCCILRTEEGSEVAFLKEEKLTHYSEKVESDFNSLRERYIAQVKKNIKHRFRKEDSQIFNDFSLLLEPSVLNDAQENESENAIEALGVFYGEEKTVKIVHGDMETGHHEEINQVSGLLNAKQLKEEWPMLKGMLSGSYKKLPVSAVCKRVIKADDMFPEFSKLCTIALCISVTSVECERSFSTQNRIKSKYRSSLKTDNLNNLITIALNEKSLTTFNPRDSVALWEAKKRRRKSSANTTKTTNKSTAARSTHHKVCAVLQPPHSTDVKARPPLKSRISSFEANKTSKFPTSKHNKETKGGTKLPEFDTLYAQIKQYLEIKKSTTKSRFADSKNDVNQSKSSNHFVLLGDVTKPLPKTSKVVRIFTSSTFTDTMLERNMLLEETYPRIKLFCQTQGYDFQVVDMRWGVRDESTDDHMGTTLCLKELTQCRDMSTGPFFVTMLSHKYGYCALPREIDALEFEKILKCVQDEKNTALLKKWYIRDDNAVPPLYVLQSISKILPEFLSPDADKKLVAKSKWWEDNDAMQQALYEAAKKALEETEAEKYVISVSEKEVKAGLLDIKDANKHCLWFKRNIRGIDKAESSKLVSRFTECLGPEEKIKKAKMMLSDLKEKKIPKVLSPENIYTYDIDWTEKGIDPENSQHKEYLKKMTTDFETHICRLIKAGIQEREQGTVENNVLFEECLQHLRFAHEKSKNFHGRGNVMKKIESYLNNDGDAPLVVHGESGSGKTSIMAQTAMMTASTVQDTVVVIRFIGTTPRSSNINSLLKSICLQIKTVFGDTSITSEDPEELVLEFQRCLQDLPTKNKELLLLLDSMDQLDTSHQGRQLGWMPTHVPQHVRIIVSTLEDEKYECFPSIRFLYPSSSNYIAVEKLPEVDVKSIVDSWLKGKQRTLTKLQRDLLLQSFDQCPLPLNLKLSFDEACRWTSSATKDSTRLQTTIRDSINRLFFRLERIHGELFVSRTLGYITAAKSGLSEGEIEDILACDDDVLNDVYTYWTPPLRRLPPLLLLRLKADLSEYIVERGADGLTVMYWYHRQFIQAAQERYCQKEETLHVALADFFNGTWSNGKKKPYKDKSGKISEADRFVSSQPLMFGSTFNVRKLNNLPYHRIKAGQIDLAKMESLCSFRFMFCKLLATSCSNLLSDYTLATQKISDKEICIIRDTLQLSEHALIFDKLQLVPQLIDRLSSEKTAATFLTQLKDYPFSYLLPYRNMLMKPGGSLVYSLSGHTKELRAVDMKQDGSTVVSCAYHPDNSIKLWDVKNGKLIKSIENIAQRAVKVFFICNDSMILVHFYHNLVAIKETGEVAYTISIPKERTLLCPAHKGRVAFLVFQDNTIEWYDAQTGKKTDTIKCPEGVQFSETGVAVGSKSLVAATVEPREKFIVFDLLTKMVSLYNIPYPEKVKRRHIIKSLAIMPDERHVIFSIRFNNDIRFLDISTMTEDRFIEGDRKDFTLGQFVLSPDGTELFYQVGQNVCTWNLKEEKFKWTFLHPGYVLGLASTDWKTMVTISNDPILRVWDLTKKMKDVQTNKVKHLAHMYDYGPVSNPRYLLGLAQLFMMDRRMKGEDEDYAVVAIDMATNVVSRKCQMNEKPRLFEVLNDSEVIICSSDRKLKVLNVEKMEVTRSFQGKMFQHIPFTRYGYLEIAVLKDRGELVTVTKGRKHFKIYDLGSGMTKSIIKVPSEDDCRLKELTACHDGSVVIANSTVDKFFILDMNSKLLTVIGESELRCLRIFEFVHITSSGNVALFIANFIQDGPWEFQLHRVREKKVGVRLSDNGYPQSSFQSFPAVKFAVPNVRSIEDWGFITSYLDNVIRIWDSEKGTILHRLSGHAVPVTIPPVKKGARYFITHSRLKEENAIRVWDIKTMECVASLKQDGTDNLLVDFCGDLRSFYSLKFSPVNVNHFSLKGLGCDVDITRCRELYKGTAHKTIDLNVPTPNRADDQDPDDDPDEEDEFDDD